MSKTKITIDEAGKLQHVILPNTTSEDVIDLLMRESVTKHEVIEQFLQDNALTISFETPNSSNIESIAYDATYRLIIFNFQDGASSQYTSSFEKFLDAMKAPSAGKLQWAYRRKEL